MNNFAPRRTTTKTLRGVSNKPDIRGSPSFGHIAAAEIDLLNDGNKRSWGGPFNGQASRTSIMEAILDKCLIENVVETGTFRGTTTEFLACMVTGRVYSCESEPRYFLYSRRRLEPLGNVEIHLADSRAFLQALLSRDSVRQARTLFYLDAHWSIDLPLASEVEIILKSHSASIVAIDDFEVPFDRDCGFDDYGPDKRLWLPILSAFRDAIPNFYVPSMAAAEETGAKRGCIWFASDDNLISYWSKCRTSAKSMCGIGISTLQERE